MSMARRSSMNVYGTDPTDRGALFNESQPGTHPKPHDEPPPVKSIMVLHSYLYVSPSWGSARTTIEVGVAGEDKG